MSKIGNAIYEIHHMDQIAARDQWVNQCHPLVKFLLTVLYIAVVVSFQKYDLIGLTGMCIYPIALFILAELSFRDCLRRLRVVLPLVCMVGLANPFFDRTPVDLGFLRINAGVISMLTLMMKGTFAILASYLLIATTSIEKLCYALRAPNQKGVHFKVWGSLTGQLLLRSIDRANEVYESMTLRGYNGEFRYLGERTRLQKGDVCYFLFWAAAFLLLRRFPLITIVGNLIMPGTYT